jgi:hypothetical protein
MVTAALEYPAAIVASVWRTSAAVSSRSLSAPTAFGSRTFWFFLIVLAERPSSPGGEPVLGGLPDGVVDVAGLRDDPLVEFLVQVPELADDGGLGWPLTLRRSRLPSPGAAYGDLAAPQARAVPVASGVAAGVAAVFE